MGAEAHFHVPRLEPMGAASSDSLSGGSNSSQRGEDSTERLPSGRAKVHPMDKEKGMSANKEHFIIILYLSNF